MFAQWEAIHPSTDFLMRRRLYDFRDAYRKHLMTVLKAFTFIGSLKFLQDYFICLALSLSLL